MKRNMFEDIAKIADELNDIEKKPTDDCVTKVDNYVEGENKKNKIEHESEVNEQNKQKQDDFNVLEESDGLDMETLACDDSELDEIIKIASEMNIGMNDVMGFIDKIAEEFGVDIADSISEIILSINKAE
jgi:hypothetical protein